MEKKFLEPEIEILNFLCFMSGEDEGHDSYTGGAGDNGDDFAPF